MLIIDAHLDLAWNALQWNRNLLDSVYTIRTTEGGTPGKGRAQGTVALPEMRQGRVAVSIKNIQPIYGQIVSNRHNYDELLDTSHKIQ